MITNQLHGLCKECIIKDDFIQNSDTNQNKININLCVTCKENQSTVLDKTFQAICTKCFLMSKINQTRKYTQQYQKNKKTATFGPLKTQGNQCNVSFLKMDKKGGQHNISFIKIDKKNNKSQFYTQKTMKQIDNLLTKYKPTDLLTFMSKKALLQGNIKWQQIIQKVDRKDPIVYIFMIKNAIIGAFHYKKMKFDKYQNLKDQQIKIFMTDRNIIDVQFYSVKQDIVNYNFKDKNITFGNPSSLTISFGQNGVELSSQLLPMKKSIQWVYFHVLNVIK